MPTTTPHGIQYPDGDSAITPLQNRFYELASTTNSALNTVKATVDGNIATLQSDVTVLKSRLALNLQSGSTTPSGAPANSGIEGSMAWDSTNDILYTYANSAWKKVWERLPLVSTGLGRVTAASGWTVTFQYVERNGIVNLSVAATRSGSTISSTTTGDITNVAMFTIESGYGPYADQVGGAVGGSGRLASTYIATRTGYLAALAPGNDLATGATYTFNYTYIKE